MVKKKWLNEFLSDKYVKDANREGFRSRAAFKLLEIDEECGLFNNCSSVLDLGCAPGSWLQVAKRKMKSKKRKTGTSDAIFPIEYSALESETTMSACSKGELKSLSMCSLSGSTALIAVVGVEQIILTGLNIRIL